MVVEGHTNAKKKNRGNPGHLKLSAARAKMVIKQLRKLGVDKKMLKAVGYGASRPLIDIEGGSEVNQRVEFVVDVGDTKSAITVEFDSGESYHYNNRSLHTGKMELQGSEKKPKELTVADFEEGSRVTHKAHGEGTVKKVDVQSSGQPNQPEVSHKKAEGK